MKHEAERIDGLIKAIMEKLDKKANPAGRQDVEQIWKEVAGEKASSHTKPVSLKKKRLIINVGDSNWLYELTLRKKKLLVSLKKRLGKEKIEELQFRIGEL